MTPRATYRLQLTSKFGFSDAAGLAPYLAGLGISHVYTSPIFAARPGSTHGYDVTDPTRLNPELGTEQEFREMAEAFRARELGLIVDFVPNHVGVGGSANAYWLDVLEWGAESRCAQWFDIDWDAAYPGLAGKLLVPFLGDQYGVVLADGGLALRFDADAGEFAVWAHDTHKLPICPRDYGQVLRRGGVEAQADAFDAAEATAGDPLWDELKAALAREADAEGIARALAAHTGAAGDIGSWETLAALIARQHWRAAKFNLDCDAINYRRFFTISELAGVRVELPGVFDATHRLVLELLDEGAIDGIRIDHIDGLLDPKDYCLRLRERAGRPFYLPVEKILAPDESLRADWGADGTTGYEFANLLVGLLVDPAGTEALSETYSAFTGSSEPPAEIVHAAKREVMGRAMAGELEGLTGRLLDLAVRDPRTADLGRSAIRAGLAQVIAAFGVYRTYVDHDGATDEDRDRIGAAVAEARRRAPALDPALFGFIEAVLTLDLAKERPDDRADIVATAMRVQQFSGPVMAKGLEDAALYRYNRLIALNEVGSEPGHFGLGVAEFHRANAERLAREPAAMLATSTHDTKRGEDARARIAAISGRAELWREKVEEWHGQLAGDDPIDRNEEYFFYQLLLGAWPFEWRRDNPLDADALADLAARVEAAMLKSAREAGVNTRWVFGDPDYESAVSGFVARALDPAPGNAFLASFRDFEAEVAEDGAANALIQTALKLTVPGVPDIYQGAELWEQSLVDPDNRRPIDFAGREAALGRLGEAGATEFGEWEGGAPKLALTAALLGLRRDRPRLFSEGSYEPVAAEGPAAARICAFLRRQGDATLLVAAALGGAGGQGEIERTSLALPSGARSWRSVLDGGRPDDLTGGKLFARLPVALLISHRPEEQ
jgi:(1->4)-alpha-D-glucan 1-alpha-D-glucosylmutase